MRKQNSEFLTSFTSEATCDIKNTDCFGYIELDDFACYVMADGIDDQMEAISAKLAVDTVITIFSEAPSMSKKMIKKCLVAANGALLRARSRTALKASIIIVVTDYVKLRYGQAGNIRLRLYRNGFIKEQTTDQSLTMDMVKQSKVPQDKIAIHEERNNLYAYLGQGKEFHPYISKKIKLTNEDIISFYTRGIWEHVDEGEMKDAVADASNKPQELVNTIEDLLMSRQPQNLRKYTFAVIFVNKIFIDPNKKRKIKKIMMLSCTVITVFLVVGVLLYTSYQRRQDKIANMEKNYMDTIEYIQMDNYSRAEEYCKNAQLLADELKDKKMQKELGNYLKLIEAVLAAQDFMNSENYVDAQEGFKEALIRSRYADNLGKDYIDGKLLVVANHLSVYDYIYLGDMLMAELQYDKAEDKYLEAKALATKIYFSEGRTASLDALEKLYESQKKQKEAEAEEMKNQLFQEESAANYLAQGDTAYVQGDYESAKVFYQSAMQKYEDLKDEVQQDRVKDKIAVAEEKIEKRTAQLSEAETYMSEAMVCLDVADYIGTKKYYLLARDIYATLKLDDKLSEIERKIEALEIKEEAQQAVTDTTDEQQTSGE